MADVDVSVEAPAEPDTSPVVEDGDTTVIVSDSEASTEPLLDHERRLTELSNDLEQERSRRAELEAQLANTQTTAEVASVVAVEASEDAQEAIAVASEEPDDTDSVPPKRTHPFFRSWSEWRGK